MVETMFDKKFLPLCNKSSLPFPNTFLYGLFTIGIPVNLVAKFETRAFIDFKPNNIIAMVCKSLNKISLISSFVASLLSGFLLRAVLILGITTNSPIIVASPQNELSPLLGSRKLKPLEKFCANFDFVLFVALPKAWDIGVVIFAMFIVFPPFLQLHCK